MSKKLTRELIIQKVHSDRFVSIKNLNLWGSNIDDVSILQELPNLEIVSLSVNHIRSLKPFSNLSNLRELYLRKNLISDLNEIKYLANCENLRTLWLSENPICENPNYRNIVISILPQLVKLDETLISDEEREELDNVISSNHNNVQNNNLDYEKEFDEFIQHPQKNNSSSNNKKYNNDIESYNNYENNKYNENKYTENKYNTNMGKNSNKYYDDEEEFQHNQQIRKVSTYKDKEIKYDNDDNYRNNKIKRYPTTKGEEMNEYYEKHNYNKYEDYNNNEFQNSRAQRKMDEQYNNYGYRENIKNNNRGYNENSNILKCVLMLLKELNKNELNIVKNEIEKQNNY